ncbi:hypothetical protein [Achromobacter sp. DH1f]|uniref:hypothetical protein n=1 Tax=Achromobacter sp. DH1f TaxID=1397275 RepID=UPI00046954B4|nr:hypothetical protein [Achromobacter sp. DH1f]
MPKLIKAFVGVPEGDIYPVRYEPGDECPPELVAGATEVGALDAPSPDNPEKVELFAQLDAAGIKYAKNWGVEKLRAALVEGKKD